MAKLWTTYCIPRMLYGSPLLPLNKRMSAKLDSSQSSLFKKILGLPKSSANESVFLLTSIIPISSQIDLRTLLLCLPHDRFEFSTLLAALPLVTSWKTILTKYQLPTLPDLINNPPAYPLWKRLAKSTIHNTVISEVTSAIKAKKSLSSWSTTALPPPLHLYYPPSLPHLRIAIILRSQLATQTYPVQLRLYKL